LTFLVLGSLASSFFVIEEGEVEVNLGDIKGDHRVLTRLGKGNILGEMSLLTGAARCTNI
jgi:CRP-like cAMP-binding protein